ncbi:MAG: peptidase, partial [Xanthomonadales bacterium]|nr:peptidase [Xanthomonadales bacterium]NIX13770.1 peptidase [Xanthomonadales bacterium]
MNRSNRAVLAAFLACYAMTGALAAPGPTPFPDMDYGSVLGESYDPAIPTPESLLGFPVGQRAATPEQIVAAVQAWSAASDRVIAVEYARSHEDRPLYYVMVSSPDNLARLDEVKAGIARLADPAGLSDAEADGIIADLPATAWMAYSIHGNESSGADAALAAIYHLVASKLDSVGDLLEKTIIFIDPS